MTERVLQIWRMILRIYVARSLLFVCLLILARNEQLNNLRIERNRKRKRYSLTNDISFHEAYVHHVCQSNDIDCFNAFRMDTQTFKRLAHLLSQSGGLVPTQHVSVSEQLAMFLSVISHHLKMRVIGIMFKRSTHTVHLCVHNVLYCIMKINKMFYPKLLPVDENCDQNTWSVFKGCVGAIDGTYMPVHVLSGDLPRFRCRKGSITTNVLAACDPNMLFTYCMVGWEGNAHDGRIIREAVSKGRIIVPTGTYYLVDNGYTNGDGFLAPYRGVRYHLKEWDYSGGPNTPQDYKEYFNMRHSRARNVIERTFGMLKRRWGILRSCSFYPLETQLDLMLACMLINNFVRMNMSAQYLDDDDFSLPTAGETVIPDHIEFVEPSNAWSQFRDNMAQEMYADWLVRRSLRANAF